MSIHFIQDPIVLEILQAILDAAGPNFAAPFDGDVQPYDGVSGNNDTLLQFQLPAGASLRGYAEPSNFGSIGTAINTMLAAFAPAFSAYALILPILGVIRGIIEVLCALKNPFKVIRALIRLFKKWIPPFISLFPPFAGVILVISVIKALIAIAFYILTVVIPTIQLIIDCFKKIAAVLGGNLTQEERDAILASIEGKLTSVLTTLAQKFGILGVLLPLLEILFTILGLVSGFPCKKGNSGKSNASLLSLNDFDVESGIDSSCCEELCPEILSDRSRAPSGVGVLIAGTYGDCAPGFVFRLITNNPDIAELAPYHEASEAQLSCLLDSIVGTPAPVGSTSDTSTLKIRLSNTRGTSKEIVLPILEIVGTEIKVTSPLAALLTGTVNYTIEPDYEMLVYHELIGLGCHPDVQAASLELEGRFAGLETPVIERFPEIASLFDDTSDLNDQLANAISDLQDAIDKSFTDPNGAVDDANGIQDGLVDLLNAFINDLTGRLGSMLDKMVDTSASLFEVSTPVVFADGQSFSTITITPRDVTGTSIIKNLPDNVGLTINIFTTFGIISNQVVDNENGIVTAEIRSPIAGEADITVNINGDPIVDIDGTVATTRVRQVRFVQEATLPARRRRSKPSSGKAINTGTTSEKEPGNK